VKPILRGACARLAAVTGALVLAAAPSAALAASSAPAVRAAPGVGRLACGAAMTNRHPRDFTSTGVKVRTVAFAHIRTVAHYRTVNHPKHGTASSRGRRTIWYYISGATPGYRVVVDVYVSRRGRTGRCQTWFTPRR
jgi:hypothetical protein